LTDPVIYLTFLSLQIGTTLAIPLFYLQRKATLWRETKEGRKDVPEHKLLWAFFCKYPSTGRQSYINVILAAFLFPMSMFWLAWTGRPPINMYVSLGGLVGFAISCHISMFSRHH
jgi:hypothetical protein